MVKHNNEIVIICNHSFFLDLISRQLGAGDYKIVLVEDLFAEGLLEQYQDMLKLVIIDINQHQVDESRMLDMIGRYSKIQEVEFLLICGSRQWQMAVRALNVGATDTIDMPCETEIMKKRVKNVLEFMELKYSALRDPLTGIYNRTAFERNVRRSLNERTESAAFLMMDIDNFKFINDNYGHGLGDAVLITVANLLEKLAEKGSIIGRMGGDEFAIFFPNIVSYESFVEHVQEIHKELGEQISGQIGGLSVLSSMGVSMFPEHGSNFSELYKRADKAQYESKNKGKNRVTIFTEA